MKRAPDPFSGQTKQLLSSNPVYNLILWLTGNQFDCSMKQEIRHKTREIEMTSKVIFLSAHHKTVQEAVPLIVIYINKIRGRIENMNIRNVWKHWMQNSICGLFTLEESGKSWWRMWFGKLEYTEYANEILCYYLADTRYSPTKRDNRNYSVIFSLKLAE